MTVIKWIGITLGIICIAVYLTMITLAMITIITIVNKKDSEQEYE